MAVSSSRERPPNCPPTPPYARSGWRCDDIERLLLPPVDMSDKLENDHVLGVRRGRDHDFVGGEKSDVLRSSNPGWCRGALLERGSCSQKRKSGHHHANRKNGRYRD